MWESAWAILEHIATSLAAAGRPAPAMPIVTQCALDDACCETFAALIGATTMKPTPSCDPPNPRAATITVIVSRDCAAGRGPAGAEWGTPTGNPWSAWTPAPGTQHAAMAAVLADRAAIEAAARIVTCSSGMCTTRWDLILAESYCTGPLGQCLGTRFTYRGELGAC